MQTKLVSLDKRFSCKMYYVFVFIVFFVPIEVNSYNTKARFAEWDLHDNGHDEVGDIIKSIAEEDNTTRNHSLEVEQRIKRSVTFDGADDRTGFRVEAASFIRTYKKTPTLGDCTLGSHRYKGDVVYTPFPSVKYKYSEKSDRLRTNEYKDIIGGAGVSFLGLIGGSVKARVQSTVKRDRKSLIIYSHFTVNKGMISLANSEVGKNWQRCTKIDKHYYLRDILTGMDDYLLVQLQFKSEAKRREVEVKIRVKFLFFSATKTIRKIKTSFTSDFSLSVYRVRTFPTRRQETLKFGNVDSGIKYLEALEKGRVQVLRDVEAAKFDDQRLHMNYYFQPCMIRTIIDSLPFKPAWNFVLIELIERSDEMESVLQDIKNVKPTSSASQIVKLGKLENEIKQRLSKIGDWKTKKLSNIYAQQLLSFYGVNRAPYYYQRQLNWALSDS